MKQQRHFQTFSYLERLAALHRSMMRQYAQQNELLMVHLEILCFLFGCNKFSDTVQSLAAYLGQTKGSISQSISFLEDAGYLIKEQDQNDKRIFHLLLTTKAKNLVAKFNDFFEFPKLSEKMHLALQDILHQLQQKNDFKNFGICSTCEYNLKKDGQTAFCALTNENLSGTETLKRCVEHEAV